VSFAESFGRGAMTQPWNDATHSDCILVIGSNPAANHPLAFRYFTEAKLKGAKLIVLDPRVSQTAAKADLYAHFRSGTDIALIGGMIRYVIEDIESHTEKYNLAYITEYTNAPYLVNPDFKGPGELDGLFSGYAGGINETDVSKKKYDKSTWTFQLDDQGNIKIDKTLKDPKCVFQLLKKHFARYTPEKVSSITGTPKDTFLEICRTFAATGQKYKAGLLTFSIASCQHTHGCQNVTAYSILQLLLGNIGVSGGGINALRGIASVGGSVDMALHPYVFPGTPQPQDTDTRLDEYLERVTPTTNDPKSLNWVSNLPKYFVSLLKAWYRDAANKDNMFGYHYLPKYNKNKDYTMMAYAEAMEHGIVKGLLCWGQNWAVSGPNANAIRMAMDKLDWMVATEIFPTETTDFWHRPGVNPAEINTEVFLLPALSSLEKEGSLSSSHRWIQWRWKVADGPGVAKSELWMVNKLALKLKELYAQGGGPNAEAIIKLAWEYGDIPDPHQVAKEVNGYDLTTGKLVDNFTQLKDDGTTSCGLWLYSGQYTEEGNMMARRDPTPNTLNEALHHNWGYCWPVGRNIIYNRASVDLNGEPWNKEHPSIWWKDGKWIGDVPDGPAPPMSEGGYKPFIMKADGIAKIFCNGLDDGPFPEHYEPWESPVRNQMSKQQNSPCIRVYRQEEKSDPARFPIVGTQYRLGSMWNSGAMSRNLPWLAELQPEPFVEISEELATEKGITNGDRVVVENKRGQVNMIALVTKCFKPFNVADKIVHQVGLIWHWGNIGLSTGDSANVLTSYVGDANTMQPEQKVFLVNIRKA
jgi:formate dehydrogenase major subunit